MIKLMVTDMDGTFLTDDKRMPEGVDAVLAELKKKGIRFVVASGRQYPSLEKHFPNQLEDITFVAQNGAYAVAQQKELFSFPMKPEDITLCLDVLFGLEGMEPIICGKGCEYTRSPEIFEHFTSPQLQYEMKLVEDLYTCANDAVKMFVVFHSGKSIEEGYQQLKAALHDGLHIATSGSNIIDIGTVGVTKGAALARLQEEWNIKPEETAVFGDQYNDVEMLELGYYSYVMENAPEGMAQYARFQGGDNNKGFVLEEIRRLAGLQKNGEK